MAMFPPIFNTLFASTAVKALLGSAPLRVYVAGEAPQGVAKPYATFQTVSGVPENYLGTRSDMDAYLMQIDIWASTLDSSRDCADAVRTALEAVAYVTAMRETPRDGPTKSFHFSLDVDFLTAR